MKFRLVFTAHSVFQTDEKWVMYEACISTTIDHMVHAHEEKARNEKTKS